MKRPIRTRVPWPLVAAVPAGDAGGPWRAIQLALTIVLGVLLLLFVGWIVKRRFIDRKPIPGGVASASRANLMNLLNADQRAAVEHQMYMEEEESREDDQGAPP